MSENASRLERRRRRLDVRLLSVGVLLALGWVGIGYRLTVVQGARADEFAAIGRDQRIDRRIQPADRGTIFDRNGRQLAVTVDSVSVYANPREIHDPDAAALVLAPLVGLDLHTTARLLSEDAGFVYVKRQLSREEAQPIRDAGLPGIYFLNEPRRAYPMGSLASQVVGFVESHDNRGLEGLEYQYDSLLAGTPGELIVERDPYGRPIPLGESSIVPAEPGADLVTTIHSDLQYAAAQALAAAIERTGAVGGTVIVIDPETGEILAMANWPPFDPEDRSVYDPEVYRNRAVTDVFEPGSTQKIITVAAALETGIVEPSTTFEIPDVLVRNDTVFKDVTQHDPVLDVTGIVANSSNIGTILLGEALGSFELHPYLFSFGQGRSTLVDFPGEGVGVLRPPEEWCETTCTASTSIGYRISVTPLQQAMVYSTIANDGVWVQPHLVSSVVDADGSREAVVPKERRVVSSQTASEIRRMLEAVVAGGTGVEAAVEGYSTGGKTGTTRKYDEELQSYSEEVVASFIGMAPIDDPKVVVAVVLDSPAEDASGGSGAAPVFAEVTEAALHHLGVPPDDR